MCRLNIAFDAVSWAPYPNLNRKKPPMGGGGGRTKVAYGKLENRRNVN